MKNGNKMEEKKEKKTMRKLICFACSCSLTAEKLRQACFS